MGEVGREYYPSKLLSKSNTKTIKGEKYGWDTHVMYLAPHKQNALGKNLCTNASAGCIAACLYTAGRGRFNNVQLGRMNKTRLFLTEKDWFIKKLKNEVMNINVTSIISKDTKLFNVNKQCVRLNGTSDIPWENIKVVDAKNIFELFSDVQFYDYTKDYKRVIKNTHKNYHLTFSRSECNEDLCVQVLDAGHNVAAVFNTDFYNRNLKDGGWCQYQIQNKLYKVVDGDTSDLRFLDEQGGVIVGLKAKGDASKDKTGFVI